MIILGVDPGIAIVGYGVVRSENGGFSALDYGVINTPGSEETPARLAMIAGGLERIIEKYKPDAVAVEELFFTSNQKTVIRVAEARGVILLTATMKCGSLYEYTPLEVKQAVTGYGRADKAQMQQMVKVLLNLKSIPRPDDAADALAVALCHGQTARYGYKKLF